MASVSRRDLLVGGLAAAALAACSSGSGRSADGSAASQPSPSTSASASTPPGPPVTSAGGPARFVPSGPAGGDAVALTFHTNGDPALCASLFEDARQLHVPVTFFMVGTWLDAEVAVARQLLADGHELANHTWTHPELGKLAAPQVAEEITRCRDELATVTGSASRWFRPSGIDAPTPLILEEAGKAGYGTVVGFDIDPLDYKDPGAQAVADRVRERLHPGAIVSLHTGHAGTVDAFADIVASIRAAGLRPVTVSELLGV